MSSVLALLTLTLWERDSVTFTWETEPEGLSTVVILLSWFIGGKDERIWAKSCSVLK